MAFKNIYIFLMKEYLLGEVRILTKLKIHVLFQLHFFSLQNCCNRRCSIFLHHDSQFQFKVLGVLSMFPGSWNTLMELTTLYSDFAPFSYNLECCFL